MGKLKWSLPPVARRRGPHILLILAAFLAVDVVYQAGMHTWWRVWISRQTRALAEVVAPATQPAKKEKTPRPPEIAAAIKKRNIFTAPRPTGHGFSLTGVIFDRAMFNSRDGGAVTLKEGESSGGVKVKSINGYEVVIEYEGKPQTMKLFDGAGGGPGGPPPDMGGRPRPAMAAPPGAMPAEIRMEAAPGMPPGMDLSNLPPEVREQVESRMRRRGR